MEGDRWLIPLSLGRSNAAYAIVPAVQDPPLTPVEELRLALAPLKAAIERLAISFDQIAALLTRTSRWTPRPGRVRDAEAGAALVEIILSESQLARLKAVVPKGSVERAALDAADYFADGEITPETIAVMFSCTPELAQRLLDIARVSCPDVAIGIRAAIDQQAKQGAEAHARSGSASARAAKE